MKKLLLSGILGLLTILVYAQSPGFFKYQTIIRNNSGELISNQNVSFKISILGGSETGTPVYTENHSVTSSAYGVCNLEIGNGNNPSSNFELIDWGSNQYFLKIELDESGGSAYKEMGAVQLLSVPYSLHSNSSNKAKSIDNPVFYLSDVESVSDTLFAVRDRDGNIVFAVYPDGVMVYVNETAKGKIGGFAVSGRNPAKATEENYMVVTADSTRVYVNQPLKKGKIGGFAVSGRNPAKAIEEDYLVVTADSTRIYVNQETTKGKIGGFAVSGRNPAKSSVSKYMSLTSANYLIGHNSGLNVTDGIYNSVLGYESGKNLLTGSTNAFVGFQSGFSTQNGSGNLFLGYQTGYANISGSYNTFMGYKAGFSNITGINNSFLGSFTGNSNTIGSYNTFIGDSTGFNNTSGDNNTFVGTKVGFNNTNGWANLFIGNYAGYSNDGGFENIFLGDHSGYSNVASGMNVAIGVRSGFKGEDGWNNVYLGTETGYSNINGSGNVFIGYQTGMNNTGGTRNIFIGNRAGMDQQGSDKLIIDNTDLDSTGAFIWGDLNARYLRFNAKIGIGANPSFLYDLVLNNTVGLANQKIMGVGDSYNYSQFILAADDGVDTTEYIVNHDLDHRYRLFYYDGEDLFPRLGIDTLGRVMIGSWDDGSELLHVNGTARFENVGIGTSSNYQNLAVYNGVDPAIVSIMGKGNTHDYATLKLEADIETDTLSYMLIHDIDNRFRIFYYDGTDLFPRIGIGSDGKVMIGGPWIDATEMLDVDGNARFRAVGTGTYANDLCITGNGTLTTQTSDKRLKTNLQPLNNSLEKVLKLKGYTFDWKSKEENKSDVGLIAQEVLEIFPEAVFKNPNDGYYGINYSRFPALFIEAFKEQNKNIEKQKLQIEKLQKENEEIKQKLDEILRMLKNN